LVGVIGVLVCGGWCWAGVASATTGHAFAGEFGARGIEDGQFANGPSGVATASSGDVFALGGDQVLRFSDTGAFELTFVVDQPHSAVRDVAVGPGDAIYVRSLVPFGPAELLKYDDSGTFLSRIDFAGSGVTLNWDSCAGLAVDPVDGSVFVVATDDVSQAQVIARFDASGAFVGSFDGANGSPDLGFACPTGLAVDGAHRVYVLDGTKGRVDQYSATGAFGATVDDGVRGAPFSVAADPVSSEVYVGESGQLGAQVTHFSAGGASVVYTFDVSVVAGAPSIAVSGAGTVYVPDSDDAVVVRFTRFDGPTVTTDPATAVDARSVTLNGSINPMGIDSRYHFEYGLDQHYGSRTPDVGVGSGSSVVSTPAELDGLSPSATYHFRIVGSNDSGSIVGVDQSFTTAAAVPTVDVVPPFASAITPRSATVHGSVNASNSLLANYDFEYGKTSAYGSLAVGAPGASLCFFDCNALDRAVAAPLSGLEPGTLYHFRVVASNLTGGVQGVDQTFVTAPAAAAGAVEVTAKRAVLRGTIDGHGVATSYHFNYGLTAAYGSSTPEADGGGGDGERLVSQEISGLRPSTIYHVQVVAKSGNVIRSGGDGVFVTAPAPGAVATVPTGVTTSAATLTGTATTFNTASSYHFELSALDGSYAVNTPERALEAAADGRPVSASLTGLPAGTAFRVQLVVSGNEVTTFSDQLVFSTAPVPQVIPEIDQTRVYGCASPHVDTYDKRPDPGDVITVSGQDLGLGGTVVLGGESFTPTDWSQTGFKVRVPDDAKGTLGLTVNCGRVSNTVAVAIFAEPDNRFSVPTRSTTAAGVRLVVRVPGPGKLETSGARIAAGKVTVKKAGKVTISVRLNRAGARALVKASAGRLRVGVGVRFTPAGGKPAAKPLTVTFQRKAGR
jgi:hypothetical protein